VQAATAALLVVLQLVPMPATASPRVEPPQAVVQAQAWTLCWTRTQPRSRISEPRPHSDHAGLSSAAAGCLAVASAVCTKRTKAVVAAWQRGSSSRRRRQLETCAIRLGSKTSSATLRKAASSENASAPEQAVEKQESAKREQKKSGEEEEEEDEEEEELQYRQATPRERQFGYFATPSQSSSGQGKPVSLPISQLHAVAAQRQLPLMLDASPVRSEASEIVSAWAELLLECQKQAPQLLKFWHTGVGPLLRLASAVPRERWLRSPHESWAAGTGAKGAETAAELVPGFLDGPEGPGEGAEVLPCLEALVRHLLCRYDVPGAVSGGFTWSDGAGGVLRERPGREVVLCSGIGLQQCIRFIRLYAAVGSGEGKPVSLAKEILTPGLTKKMVRSLLSGTVGLPPPPPVEVPDAARHVQPVSVTLAGPLAALRTAQIAALGGPEALARALAGGTRLGSDLGAPDEESFAESVMAWACRFADTPELADGRAAAMAVEWLLSQHRGEPGFSVIVAGNSRAPKKVLEAARRAAASLELQRLQATGQRFLPNPWGIQGFVKRDVMTAFGSPFENSARQWLQMLGLRGIAVSEEVPNSWHGDEYEYSSAEASFLAEPSVQRRATVRIDEILSFEYLQHVGQTMRNCLRVERRGGASLMKYLSRVRSRESSFWVMTITAEPGEGEAEEQGAEEMPVQHLLLVELYNDLRVIHQAEGPHPRRWPRPDAWRWLQEWAEQEGLRPDGPEGVTVGPYGSYRGHLDRWDIRRCFLW